MSSCRLGGEERDREDNSFHVAFVRWQATLATGEDAGSGCVLTNNKDDYGEYLVISAQPGDTVTIDETCERFRTTADAWSAHPDDDEYWCGKGGSERWASVRNPGCFAPFDKDEAPARCGDSNFTLLKSHIVPGGEPSSLPSVEDVDGFRLTVELGSRGEQCLQDCDRGQRIEFVVQ
jgi:hypothetical protein